MKNLTIILKLTALLNPKIPISMVVKKEDPVPRSTLMMRFAVVRVAPCIPRRLTVIMYRQTFTDGMEAKQPPAKR